MDGYIKLYRKTLENPVICQDSEHLAVWVYLLLKATHTNYPAMFKGKRITLLPGQLLTGRKSISLALCISESKVQRILKAFESEQQIEQQTGNKNRLVSIVRWHEYQSGEQQTEQQVNNNRTTSEQQVNTNKNGKNGKNVKNEEINPPVSPLDAAIADFKDFRKKIKKPMTDRAVELLHLKLTKLAGDNEEMKIAIINQSIFNGWQGVFALKDEFQPVQEETPKAQPKGHMVTRQGAYGVMVDEWVEDE